MRIRKTLIAALVLSSVSLSAADYLTEGVDIARTGWLKDEKVFTTGNVAGMKLLWKIKLPSTPRQMHNLFPPLIAERVATPQGTREMAVVAGVTDDLFGIDVATGEMMWRRHFSDSYQEPPAGPGGSQYRTLCPGGQTDVPVVAPSATTGKYTIYTVSWDGRLRQVDLATGQEIAPAEKFMPSNGKPYALNLSNNTIYTASAQGCGGVANAFYSFDLATRKASVFTPAGGGMWGRRGVAIGPDGTVYMGTGDARFDPATKNLGNGIVAVKLDANKQIHLVDFFAPKNANWMQRRDLDVNVTPVLFDYKGTKFLVGTSKECRLWLLDRDGLGGEDHRTPLYTSPLLCNDQQGYDGQGVWGSMAAWQDNAGNQWVVVPFWGAVSKQFHAPVEHARPTGGGVGAYKVEQRNGKWQLTPAWLSRNMDLAEEVLIANGVAFVSDSGEDATQTIPDRAWDEPGGGRLGGGLDSSSPRRIPGSRHATLYALDAVTGKELWSSGNQIASWSHFSGLTAANGRVYIGTFDGTLYCFGVK
jgi:outer membrane protein assembly factor BamB